MDMKKLTVNELLFYCKDGSAFKEKAIEELKKRGYSAEEIEHDNFEAKCIDENKREDYKIEIIEKQNKSLKIIAGCAVTILILTIASAICSVWSITNFIKILG